MKKLETKADLKVTKGKRKQKWAKLTADDLQFAEERDELWWANRTQNRTARPEKPFSRPSSKLRPPAANRTGIQRTIEPSL